MVTWYGEGFGLGRRAGIESGGFSLDVFLVSLCYYC